VKYAPEGKVDRHCGLSLVPATCRLPGFPLEVRSCSQEVTVSERLDSGCAENGADNPRRPVNFISIGPVSRGTRPRAIRHSSLAKHS
jgi:hypothetical protein